MGEYIGSSTHLYIGSIFPTIGSTHSNIGSKHFNIGSTLSSIGSTYNAVGFATFPYFSKIFKLTNCILIDFLEHHVKYVKYLIRVSQCGHIWQE